MHDNSDVTTPTLRELEVLRAMMATRKTVAAAAMLGISQPAVSRAISTLESRTGRNLFVRNGGRLVPTADAFTLEAEAGAIFAALERLASWPAKSDSGGLLRVATSPTLGQYLLPEVVASFRRMEPGTRIQLEISTATDVIAAVADKRTDLGLVDAATPHLSIRNEPIREAKSHVLMRSEDPLASKARITVSDIAEREIVALTGRFAARGEAERAFAQSGSRLKVAVEVTTSMFAVELVRAGVGISLLNPFPLSLGGMAGLVARPFSPTIAYRTDLLFPSQGPTLPAARRFAEHLKANQPEDGLTIPIR
jgi:DNA-binding transcriptional LysR family regulator